jgi:hypothetical protein
MTLLLFLLLLCLMLIILKKILTWLGGGFMVYNTTFNNISVISWQSIWLLEETWVPRENHQPTASHWQTSSHNVALSTPHLRGIRNYNAVKEIRKLKSQDNRTSECLKFTGLNRISLVRQKNLKREIRWNHFDHNKQMMQVYISIFIL